jgi:uncharacterized protein
MNASETLRSDWLLLFLSGKALGTPEPHPLDPIRLQKGMFLVAKRGPARDAYSFRPYNWGPFSPQIYSDLDSLEAAGLVEGRSVPGQTWRLFRTTARGDERAEEVAASLAKSDVEWLAQARSFVTTRSFGRLLEEIYDLYPEYSVNSLLR